MSGVIAAGRRLDVGDFVDEVENLVAGFVEDDPAQRCDAVVLADLSVNDAIRQVQELTGLEVVEQRVQRPGGQSIAVSVELGGDSDAVDRVLARVVEHVDLDEPSRTSRNNFGAAETFVNATEPLYLEQVAYLDDDTPIEYSDVWIRGNWLKLSALITRESGGGRPSPG